MEQKHNPTAAALAEMLTRAKNAYSGGVNPDDGLISFARTMCDLLNVLSWNTSTPNAAALTKMATTYAATTTDSDNVRQEVLATAAELSKINAAALLYADEIEIMAALCDKIASNDFKSNLPQMQN